MAITPYCPKCGSVKVEKESKLNMVCTEPDCKYIGRNELFKNHIGPSRPENKNWRDPIGLLPGGHRDNG